MKYYQTQKSADCTTNWESRARSPVLAVLAAPEAFISNTAIHLIYSKMCLVVWGVWGVNVSISSLEAVVVAVGTTSNTSSANSNKVVKACIKMMLWYKN